MKMRIITAVVLIPLLLVLFLIAPKILTAVILGLVCAIGGYELLAGTGLVRHVRLVIYTAVVALLVPLWCHFGMPSLWAQLGVLLFVVLLFAEILISHGKIPFDRIAVCLAGGLLIPYLLSALVRIMVGIHGRYLMMVPLVLAFMSDSGAYFLGRAFGKHKLAPTISPNKSIEGVFGGVIFAILGMVIFCLIMQFGLQYRVNYFLAITYGILGSLFGVFGDLCFSAIKRQTGIKDYGNLIPGHGGILDRLDSVVMVAPVAELLMLLLPVMEK